MPVPTNEKIRRPLLESLTDEKDHKLRETVEDVGQRLSLTPSDMAELIPSGRHRLFYDHLCWTRWYLVKAELLAIPRRGYTRITKRGLSALAEAPDLISDEWMNLNPEYLAYRKAVQAGTTAPPADVLSEAEDEPVAPATGPHVWIEKTIVANRPDRENGENAMGRALWSPQRAKDGADIYRFMRDVAVGDIILHLADNEAFTGISEAASIAEEFNGVEGTEWGASPSYRVRLSEFRKLEPPLSRDVFFESPYRERLSALISAGQKNLFYNSSLALRQGAYLTPAPPALVRILDDVYQSVTGRALVGGNDAGSIEVAEDVILFNRLVRRTYWTEAALSAIIESIRHPIRPSRQIILAGPPGTGKTFVAQELVHYLTKGDPRRAHLVQFHPSYSYEQFIEGLRPTIVDGAVKFQPVNGIVLDLTTQCRNSNDDHFLIIDELNRANLPRVLGELMYLFEYRDKKIDLPYTRGFSLPPNLFFVATMNTADRNIRSIDIALRRRFDVFDCPPDADVLRSYYVDKTNQNDVPDLVDGFIALNKELTDQLDEHHTVGHAFFMASHFTQDDLIAVWKRKLQPLLSEYFFASPDIARPFVIDKFWPSAAL